MEVVYSGPSFGGYVYGSTLRNVVYILPELYQRLGFDTYIQDYLCSYVGCITSCKYIWMVKLSAIY